MTSLDQATLARPVYRHPPLVEQGAGITIRELDHGRRILTMDVGRLGTATVLGAPASRLTPEEWQCIGAARESYRHMWGGSHQLAEVQEDPFDGRGEFAGVYQTTHYIATVATPGKTDKIITMRKVAIHPDALLDPSPDHGPPLVADVGFWLVHRPTEGTARPLSEVLRSYCEQTLWGPTRPRPISRLPPCRVPGHCPTNRTRRAIGTTAIGPPWPMRSFKWPR